MQTTTDTIFEIRSMRDSITHLMEDMLYKAGKANSPEVDKEVSYAMQSIAYLTHDCLRAVSPAHTPRIAKKSTTAV